MKQIDSGAIILSSMQELLVYYVETLGRAIPMLDMIKPDDTPESIFYAKEYVAYEFNITVDALIRDLVPRIMVMELGHEGNLVQAIKFSVIAGFIDSEATLKAMIAVKDDLMAKNIIREVIDEVISTVLAQTPALLEATQKALPYSKKIKPRQY